MVTYGSTARAAISSRRPGAHVAVGSEQSLRGGVAHRQRMRQQVAARELLRGQPSHGLDDREQVAAGAAAESVRHPVRHRVLDQVLDEYADLVGRQRFDVDGRDVTATRSAPLATETTTGTRPNWATRWSR